MELERIYGIRQGSAGQSHTDNLNGKTQSDLAKQLNISQQQLQDYKKLTTLIPELQSMVEHEALKSTTAYKIWTKLSPDEQHKFFNQNFYIPEVYHFKVSIFIL